MIKEIIQFVDVLPEQAFSKNLQLKEGLYMFLDIQEENGRPTLKNVDQEGHITADDFKIWTNKSEPSSFFDKCLQIQMNTQPVSPRKNFNPDKKIFISSCSPFALSFVKKNYKKYEKNNELIKKQLRNQYFKSAENYLQKEHQKKWFPLFRDFLIENIQDLLAQFSEYQEAKDSISVNIYFKRADLNDFILTHLSYLQTNFFNKAQYNVEHEGVLVGISDSLSGFNEKKRFLQHRTGLSSLNYRISGEEAQLLWKFFKLQQNKQLPNPTPVFVDKEELDLNKDLVSFYQDDKILSYSQLIKELIKKHKKQLHNFYLIFFQGGQKGSKIVDFDFVPVFYYEISIPFTLIDVFGIGNGFSNKSIENVFDLQYNIFNKVFNGHLIQNTKDGGVWLKFFDDLEVNAQYHFTDTIVSLMYKYRQSIYDYIYKSRHQSITGLMFDNMMISSIMDDICHDKDFNRDYAIKEKLNIWFNFWNYFSEHQNRINMANKTVEILERLKTVIESEQEHVQNDNEFAFASGQLIWRILIQSKSSSRSHALLEPFLQKVDSTELKKAIARSFDTYKHEFVMYQRKYGFDKLMSEVMGYEPRETNMKNLIHMILAGYFAESLFKKEKENNQQN